MGPLYLGHHPRLVHARSHQESETFRGRGSETLFTLTDREGERSYLQSRLYIHTPEASSASPTPRPGTIPLGPWVEHRRFS